MDTFQLDAEAESADAKLLATFSAIDDDLQTIDSITTAARVRLSKYGRACRLPTYMHAYDLRRLPNPSGMDIVKLATMLAEAVCMYVPAIR